MCELFGVCANEQIRVNEYLDSFYNHSFYHKDGWGLAVFRGGGVSMEKEAVRAIDSTYLRQRISKEIMAANMFAHIRAATIGRMEYANCHPFVWDDESGRTWTLIHNGTLFNGRKLSKYRDIQEGTTDSERFLLYIIDTMNRTYLEAGKKLSPDDRFRVLDDIIVEMSDGNKLNILLYDGEYMYVHTNMAETLYENKTLNCTIFATKPVLTDGWKPLPMNQLFSYRNGVLIREGSVHNHEFHEHEKQMSAILKKELE